MNDKNLPAEQKVSGVQEFLEHLNLPQLIAGNAGQAISRLIGAGVDIPSAKLEQISQSIKDKTQAKSLVTNAIAEKTAEVVVSDPELLDRAKVSFVGDLMRKQENKETVAAIAIEELGTEEIPVGTPTIDEDWMNVFSSHVENASSERMQDLWGKVLAGEIRKPGKFSNSTLRFVSELDKEIALAFEKAASRVIDDIIPAIASKDKDFFQILLVLMENGLIISGPDAGLKKSFTLKANSKHLFSANNHGVVIQAGEVDCSIEFNVIKLTKVAIDLLSLFDAKVDLEFLEKHALEYKVDGIHRILIAKIILEDENGITTDSIKEIYNSQIQTS